MNIVKIIEELTQPAGTKVLKIRDDVAAVGVTSGAEESSQPGELPEGLPPISPQPGKISSFNNLTLGVVPDIVVLIVGDIAPIQAEEPLSDIGVEAIPPTFYYVSITIVEIGSGNTPPVPTPTMDILEELSLQMVKQFFTTMEYCTDLVLSGRSSFKFI